MRRAQAGREVWLEAHRRDLERWASLDAAANWRREALAVGVELAPTRAVADWLGPAPPDDASRRRWREAAGAIEAYRARWGLADEPVARSPALDPAWSRARQADHIHVLTACRGVERSRATERAVDDDLALSAR